MAAIFYQNGDVIDYTAAEALAFGDVVDLTTRIGVAGADIPEGGTGPVHLTGVYRVPKATGAVTVGQAVTIVLRLMGYTEEDVGALWPQDYMQKAADLGLLDGISTNSSAAMTRGEAALLLYAMLKSDTKDGSDYVAKLASSTISSAVLLSNDDEAADGTLHTAQVYAAQGGLTWYEQSTDLPDTLVGRRGTLLLDKSGKVCGFLPDDTTVRTLSLDSAEAGELSFKEGDRIEVIREDPSGWWEGKLDGKMGRFPSNYTTAICSVSCNKHVSAIIPYSYYSHPTDRSFDLVPRLECHYCSSRTTQSFDYVRFPLPTKS